MEQELLRKVQLAQLEIAKEIKRVCDENDIQYFLCNGSFLGAVRHKGFIPWDDDMDIGMLRSEYQRFCRIAPEKLRPEFCLQNWYTEEAYSLPFSKVMKRNTVYLEAKKTRTLKENGIYVDLFPYDYVPEDPFDREKITRKLNDLYRTKLAKSGYAPWMDNDRIIWKKRIGYLYYQLKGLFVSQKALIRAYDSLAVSTHPTRLLVKQYGSTPTPATYQVEWMEELADYTFEGTTFRGTKHYDPYLTATYGDYMTLPPEGTRENRHQIVEVDFGE